MLALFCTAGRTALRLRLRLRSRWAGMGWDGVESTYLGVHSLSQHSLTPVVRSSSMYVCIMFYSPHDRVTHDQLGLARPSSSCYLSSIAGWLGCLAFRSK